MFHVLPCPHAQGHDTWVTWVTVFHSTQTTKQCMNSRISCAAKRVGCQVRAVCCDIGRRWGWRHLILRRVAYSAGWCRHWWRHPWIQRKWASCVSRCNGWHRKRLAEFKPSIFHLFLSSPFGSSILKPDLVQKKKKFFFFFSKYFFFF